jgi:hypothetical protein
LEILDESIDSVLGKFKHFYESSVQNRTFDKKVNFEEIFSIGPPLSRAVCQQNL